MRLDDDFYADVDSGWFTGSLFAYSVRERTQKKVQLKNNGCKNECRRAFCEIHGVNDRQRVVVFDDNLTQNVKMKLLYYIEEN